jgi:PAS domain-containing protein
MRTKLQSVARATGHAPSIVEMNEALILGSVRQHELAGAAQLLNARLRAEITQRKRAERALRASEERFRSLFVSAPMAVFACDQDGVIQRPRRRALGPGTGVWRRKLLRGAAFVAAGRPTPAS